MKITDSQNTFPYSLCQTDDIQRTVDETECSHCHSDDVDSEVLFYSSDKHVAFHAFKCRSCGVGQLHLIRDDWVMTNSDPMLVDYILKSTGAPFRYSSPFFIENL